MEWILTLADSFSLSHLLTRSQGLLLPPFEAQPLEGTMSRVERLSSGHTVMLTLHYGPAGLYLHTRERLTALEAEELTCKTWRMLRLGENLGPFLARAEADPYLGPEVRRAGARFLRSATLFEDMVKALILGHTPAVWGHAQVAGLVSHLGDPLPSNPTRHAFPTPPQIRNNRPLLTNLLGPDLQEALVETAQFFEDRGNEVEILANPRIPMELVLRTFHQIPLLSTQALALAMLSLGRYDYIPAGQFPMAAGPAFENWQPWGGLAYWIWNTSLIPAQVQKGEQHHGQPAS